MSGKRFAVVLVAAVVAAFVGGALLAPRTGPAPVAAGTAPSAAGAPGAAEPSAPPPVPAAGPRAAGTGDVVWGDGPWGAAPTGMGAAAMLPSSRTHGPLRDLGNGLWVDYLPTAQGAAIAAMRAGLVVAAAPASLRPVVVEAVLQDPPPVPAADPALNGGEVWAIPPGLPTGPWPGSRMEVLGAVADVDAASDRPTATVDIYTLVTAPDADPATWLTTYRVVYGDRQWRLLAPQDPPGLASLPAGFTVTGPGGVLAP